MNADKIEKARSQLAAYGYTLSDSLQIEKGEKTFSVVVSAKGPRFYVKQLSGAQLWSGPDLGDFVKSFWYAKKIEQHEANATMLKESDKRVVRAFVNEKPASSNLLETDGVRLDKIGLGGETVAKWIDGRIAIVSTESVKSDESIIRLIKSAAGPGVVDFSYARKGHRVHEHGAMGRNGRATTVDPVAARELDLYIANTYELVGAPNSIGKAIDANLKHKLASGKYDSALAPKAWQYLVDEGAKLYQKEFGSDSPIFSAATRRQVAADFARAWEDENQLTRNSGNMNNFPEIDKFIRDLDSLLGGVVFDRTIKYSVMGSGSLWVNFINLPHGVGSAGGGAEAENNRVSFSVKFTGDTARVEQVASALDRKYRLRAKTGVPYAIARYLSDFLKKIVAEVNPKFTHSRPR